MKKQPIISWSLGSLELQIIMNKFSPHALAQGSNEATPPVNFSLQSNPVRFNSLTHAALNHTSTVSNM